MVLLQVAQRAVDLNRAADFYEMLLGEPPAARFEPPGLVFFALGDVRLLLDRAAPSALIYLRVDDLSTTIERLRARGSEVETEPHLQFHHSDDTLGPAGSDEFHAFIRDSEGNLIGLIEQR